MKIYAVLGDVARNMAQAAEKRKLQGYVRMLESERKDAPQFNDEFRVRMIFAIHDALDDGMTLEDIGIRHVSRLEVIITKVEGLTLREMGRDSAMLSRLGMDEESLMTFFRCFLGKLIADDARKHVQEIREMGTHHV